MGRWKTALWSALSLAWLAGCHIPSFSPVVHYPAYTARHFAAISMPAFTAAGDYYVTNGPRLLHFAAGGARLGESTLPFDASQPQHSGTAYGCVCASGAGDVFVLLGDGRAGLLDAAGQYAWLKDVGVGGFTAAPAPAGLFIQYARGDEHGVALLDTQGDLHYIMARPPNTDRFSWTVDPQGRGFFVADGMLTITAPDGALLLDAQAVTDAVTNAFFNVLCARDGHVLVSNSETVLCLDMTGQELWRIQEPEHYQGFSVATFIAEDRAVLALANNYPDQQAFMVVDMQGRQLAFKNVTLVGSITPAPGDGFLLDYTNETARYIALYDAGGAEQWAYGVAVNRDPDPSAQAGVVPDYSSSWTHLAGPDGRFYFEEQSVLYALAGGGELVWQEVGTSYYDEWIPAHTAE